MPDESDDRRIARRAVVRGAAWTAPVIVAVSAAPALAASTIVPFTKRYDGNGSTPVSATVTIPPGVRIVRYEVVGGDGSGGIVARGGNGAALTGTLDLGPSPAGAELTIIPGGKGSFSALPARGSTATAAGGAGYGDGGSSTTGYGVQSKAGGAGSAILLGTTPLVVAGGGGGASQGYEVDNAGAFPNVIGGASAIGGDAGPPGGAGPDAGFSTAYAENTRNVATADGGEGASGASGGAGGKVIGSYGRQAGTAGGDHGTGANGGGDGADGVAVQEPGVITTAGASGGGGGYAGGGSGSTASISYGSPAYAAGQTGGGGGGGSSYVSGPVAGITPNNATVGTNSGNEANGYIVISYG